jgi:hypothetical protein
VDLLTLESELSRQVGDVAVDVVDV